MNKIISQEKDVRYEMNRGTLKNEGGSNSTIGTVNTPLTFDLENNWRVEVGGAGRGGQTGASGNGVKE